jgi:hypothetical protein
MMTTTTEANVDRTHCKLYWERSTSWDGPWEPVKRVPAGVRKKAMTDIRYKPGVPIVAYEYFYRFSHSISEQTRTA